MFISGDRRDGRDRRVIICDVFFLEVRKQAKIKFCQLSLFTILLQITIFRKILFRDTIYGKRMN